MQREARVLVQEYDRRSPLGESAPIARALCFAEVVHVPVSCASGEGVSAGAVRVACGHQNAGLECELPAGHSGSHAVATSRDVDGRVDDGVSWSADHSRAAAHYSKQAADAIAQPRLQAGDRARDTAYPSDGILVVGGPTGSEGYRYMSDGGYRPENELELVEVAHYAPPGVPMVAITPERIKVLRFLFELAARYGTAFSVADILELRSMVRESGETCSRSPLIIDPALFEDLARHDREKLS